MENRMHTTVFLTTFEMVDALVKHVLEFLFVSFQPKLELRRNLRN